MEYLRNLLKLNKNWLIPLGLIVLMFWFSANPARVEYYYSTGVYLYISSSARWIFGFIPFSVGDILYIGFWLFVIFKIVKYLIQLSQNGFSANALFRRLKAAGIFLAWMVIVFNAVWGLNYNRVRIEDKLNLEITELNEKDLTEITTLLAKRADHNERLVMERSEIRPHLFARAGDNYRKAKKKIEIPSYDPSSIKTSLLGVLTSYMGVQGYYNPFSGEGHINSEIPFQLQPFVTTHEIAHQLGYARENEANFIGYLVAKNSDDPEFRYSTYLDMFMYAQGLLKRSDPEIAEKIFSSLSENVQKDIEEFKKYMRSHSNPFELGIKVVYGEYLKAYDQPKGMHTYDEVVKWLIAYSKKHGQDAI